MDEALYRCLKQLEMATSNIWLSIPHEGSEAYKALNIQNKDLWKLGALNEHLSWLQDTAKNAATCAYMQGKE